MKTPIYGDNPAISLKIVSILLLSPLVMSHCQLFRDMAIFEFGIANRGSFTKFSPVTYIVITAPLNIK